MKRTLSAPKVAGLKPKDKQYRVADGGGMYVLVKPNGSKYWRYDCQIFGKRVTLALGTYPAVSLADAREKHEQYRLEIKQGKDPRNTKQADYLKRPFSYYSDETNKRLELRETTIVEREKRMRKYVYPVFDFKPLDQITAIDVLNICQPIADRGHVKTARLIATYCKQIFDTLLAMQLVPFNPAESVSRLLPKYKQKKQFAHVTDPKDFFILLDGADSYHGDFATKKALQFMPLVFLRPRNIRELKWSQIDMDNKVINYSPDEMKMERSHKVPLSNQAIQILNEIKPITGRYELVFSTAWGKGAPLSENTLNKAIQKFIHPDTGNRVGVGFMTSHGFRHTASTLLNELRFDSDVVELQLAHLDKDRIRRIYNKAELMPERIKMMQAWADYLDGIKAGADVVPINKAKDIA